jgi:hypothetical protein
VEFLKWQYHIDGLERMEGFGQGEKDKARQALRYLQRVLGDDFLLRSSPEPFTAHHPLMMLLANFAPCSRLDLARFAAYVSALEGSENLDRLVTKLHDITQFDHNALLIKSAARLVRQGLRARFEPTMPVRNNQRQPDLLLHYPQTGDTAFVEVVKQDTQQSMRRASENNSAVLRTLYSITFDLCHSARWQRLPSPQELESILEKTRTGASRALNGRTMTVVQEKDVLDMALCHRDQRAFLLDPWCEKRGLSCGLFLGPTLARNDTFRLKLKIQREQEQLPRDTAGVVLILASDAFLGTRGVSRVIREVEQEVFKHDHVHLVIVHGEYIDEREVPFTGWDGRHRYTRRIVDGNVENDLLLVNKRSRLKLSADLLERFYSVF